MEPDRREKTLTEVQLLESLVQAIDRREEVFRAIESTETDDEARDAVAALLDVGEIQARIVLDMQARRWTLGHRRTIAGHLKRLRSELDSL
ncbi:DNA gyrase subunit A [Paeniglutamicibacter sp.]|uniref:DNA gyrase subunit A n=1 Tax=Paeniglutamicibacter sp. TaxID=1934391 RepID=UPI00398935E0